MFCFLKPSRLAITTPSGRLRPRGEMIAIALLVAAPGCGTTTTVNTSVAGTLHVALYDPLFGIGGDGTASAFHPVQTLEPGDTYKSHNSTQGTTRFALVTGDRFALASRAAGDSRPIYFSAYLLKPIDQDARDILAGRIREGMSFESLWWSWGPPESHASSSYTGPGGTTRSEYWTSDLERYSVFFRGGKVESWYTSPVY